MLWLERKQWSAEEGSMALEYFLELEPWDVAKNSAAFAEGTSCVNVKREGRGERGVKGAAALLGVREEHVW